MGRPDDWLFQIAMTLGSFWLSAGLAYCFFAFEDKKGDSRLRQEWDRADEERAQQRIHEQYYKLGDVNRNLVNIINQLGKPGFDDQSALRASELALGDALFELWHLVPKIEHEPLLELAQTLEHHIVDFNERASSLLGMTGGILDLSYLQDSRNRIIGHEADIRDGYRVWLGKEPLIYVW